MACPTPVSILVLNTVLIMGIGSGCAPAVDIHTIRSPSAHFERYRTIGFDLSLQAPRGHATSPRSAIVRDEVEKAAAPILERRGYALAPSDRADLVLRIEAGRRDQWVPASTGIMPLGGGVSGLPTSSGGPDAMGSLPVGNAPGPADVGGTKYHGELDQEDRDLVEGAFVIDAFDGETGTLVWHGSAHSEINPSTIDRERLRRAVESMLGSFPGKAAP